MNDLRPIFKFIPYNYKFGLFLILLFGIPRFLLVLNANSSGGGYGYVSIIFILMSITPFIFLSKDGRRKIGIRKPQNNLWLIYSFLIGILFCGAMFVLANLFFGDTVSNPFQYISKSYTIPEEALAANKFMFFAMFSMVGMTYSPLGEELLYRGIVHETFANQFGENKASIFDSLAFAFTHLAHFGLVFTLGKWAFLPVPALFWVAGMFIGSRLFFLSKQKNGSIWGAVVCHAAYNIGMMYFIFYHIF